MNRLRRAKARRAGPSYSIPREVWLLAMVFPHHLHNKPGLDTLFDKQTLPRKVLRQFCRAIRGAKQAVLWWYLSSAISLPTFNGKSSCQGCRNIHLLDIMGKCVFAAIYDRYPSSQPDFQYGFRRHHRREAPILIQDCQRFRLRQSGTNHFSKLYDVANAFPNVSTDALDAVMTSKNQRHRRFSI